MAVITYTGPEAAPPYIAKAFLTRAARASRERQDRARRKARQTIMHTARLKSLKALLA